MPKETFPTFETNEGPRSFEEQFSSVENLKVAGGTAEIFDIAPESPKSEVPVFFAPAWSCTAEVYKPALETLSGQERRVVTINHPRFGGDMSIAPEEAVEKYPYEEVRKAMNILGVLEQKNIEKTDVIAHSEGAVNVAIAAALHPEKFRNIVLFAPAGMIGEDTFTRLLKGFAGQGKRPESLKATPAQGENPGFEEIPVTETEKYAAKTAAKEAIKYLAKNPVRGLKEGWDISKSQIHDMLRYLHEQGVGIVVMSGVDDPVFPMEKMQEIAKTDMLDGFLSLRGGHGELGNHPEKYMVAAEQMLTALEEKKRKEK